MIWRYQLHYLESFEDVSGGHDFRWCPSHGRPYTLPDKEVESRCRKCLILGHSWAVNRLVGHYLSYSLEEKEHENREEIATWSVDQSDFSRLDPGGSDERSAENVHQLSFSGTSWADNRDFRKELRIHGK